MYQHDLYPDSSEFNQAKFVQLTVLKVYCCHVYQHDLYPDSSEFNQGKLVQLTVLKVYCWDGLQFPIYVLNLSLQLPVATMKGHVANIL